MLVVLGREVSAQAPKDRFVGALRQFLEAAAGQYGDEGAQLRLALTSMERALADWDAAIKSDEAAAAAQTPTAELHGALGVIYLDRRRLPDAVRELSAAAGLDPKRSEIRTFQAFALGLVGRTAEATQAFAEAAALAPDDAATWYRLAQVLARSGQADRAETARRQFRESRQKALAANWRSSAPPFVRVDLLRQVPNVAPIFPAARYTDGFNALMRGNYADAVAMLAKASAADPLTASVSTGGPTIESGAMLRQGRLSDAMARLTNAAESSAESHRVLGLAYGADEQLEKAVDELRSAVRIDPQDERARLALADALTAAGNLSDAEQALKEAIRVLPASGQAHYNLGRLYEFQQRWTEAASELRSASELNPLIGLDFLYATLAAACLGQPDYSCATEAGTRRIEANPNNGDAHRALADIYLQIGDHDEALTEFLAALLANSRDADSFAGIAQIHLRSGRYQDAADVAQRALDVNPDHSSAAFALGSALTRIGRADEGARALERFSQIRAKALEREQREWDLKMAKQEASVSLTKGESEAAITALRKAVSYEPNAADSHLTLGRVLKNVGRYAEAIESFEKASQLQATPEVYRLLSDTYKEMGQVEASRKALAEYQRLKEERLRKTGWVRPIP
jgi:tetratricopeptide (TPR) repeat protein